MRRPAFAALPVLAATGLVALRAAPAKAAIFRVIGAAAAVGVLAAVPLAGIASRGRLARLRAGAASPRASLTSARGADPHRHVRFRFQALTRELPGTDPDPHMGSWFDAHVAVLSGRGAMACRKARRPKPTNGSPQRPSTGSVSVRAHVAPSSNDQTMATNTLTRTSLRFSNSGENSSHLHVGRREGARSRRVHPARSGMLTA